MLSKCFSSEIDDVEFSRHSWLRRRLPKPPSEAPPANRPSAVLRHHHLHTVQQQNTSNTDPNVTGGRTNSGTGGHYTTHHQQQQQTYSTTNNTNSKTYSSNNELNRHQKLPHIGGVQLNSILDWGWSERCSYYFLFSWVTCVGVGFWIWKHIFLCFLFLFCTLKMFCLFFFVFSSLLPRLLSDHRSCFLSIRPLLLNNNNKRLCSPIE